jgi:hypothetical protein
MHQNSILSSSSYHVFSHFALTHIDISSAIKACPQNLQSFFNKLEEETGWAFTVLMGGPNPGRPDGEITVARSVLAKPHKSERS